MPVFVGSRFVAEYPTGGGGFWVPLQYVLGLRALGVEAYWLERLWPQSDVARARRCLRTFLRYVEALGVVDWVTPCSSPTTSATTRPDERSPSAHTPRICGPARARPPAQPG